ncbi:CDP-alcohol phosphatidyltransferase family protein [Bifidobacterium avesanii]|uniref:Phosphatidylinositol phosphate synthase n=1 Tax=Bifidobacterium avesanii TaxID=1798157 RepID=A0A7K3TFL7_9BIFI|nr:CDP-alcohol phosphatidyltransferase family protein [Bifidobacterium avesanii]KAB8295434.1 CDP-diacylglycerol--glycerol-3-phosphate 3-phosphatidyltransferase [Bifidobacterium avesanii]NEG77440.1 CDP-alcohol phosphatidyltransferase family protein [Bifidobacterium avesanii]
MLEKLRTPWKRIINPIARLLVWMGVSADAVTVAGALGTVVVGLAAGFTGWMLPGAVALTVLVIFDSLDGSVAALTTGGTKFGAFLDSTLDRIADWAVLAGVIVYFLREILARGSAGEPYYAAWIGAGCALFAVMTSFVTSYARARAESVGFEAKNGVATRADRLAIILVGMALTGATGDPVWLMAFMVALAALGAVTVWQRIHEVHRQMLAAGDGR